MWRKAGRQAGREEQDVLALVDENPDAADDNCGEKAAEERASDGTPT